MHCPNNILIVIHPTGLGSNPRSHTAFGCHAHLVYFNAEQFHSPSLVFLELDILYKVGPLGFPWCFFKIGTSFCIFGNSTVKCWGQNSITLLCLVFGILLGRRAFHSPHSFIYMSLDSQVLILFNRLPSINIIIYASWFFNYPRFDQQESPQDSSCIPLTSSMTLSTLSYFLITYFASSGIRHFCFSKKYKFLLMERSI